MHPTHPLAASHAPIPPALSPPVSPHQSATSGLSGVGEEFFADAHEGLPTPPRHHCRPNASGCLVWSEGRGPDPAPPFLIRWHPADGDARHDEAATRAEALGLARDAHDATSADVAVYRLWSVLPD